MKRYVLTLIIALTISLALLSWTSAQQIQVSVSTDKSTYAPGELVTITAVVTRDGQPCAGYIVGFEVRDPKGGHFPLPPVQTDSNGRASKSFRLKSDAPEGTWTVVAAVSGTNAKDTCTFTVTRPGAAPTPGKKSSSITLSLSSDTVTYGECVIISGEIVTEEGITAEVRVEYSLDNVTWSLVSTATAVNGVYNFSWCPPGAGIYFLRASWPGTDEYYGATSTIVRLTVLKASVELRLSVSKREVVLGEEITISGELEPALSGIPVLIEYSVDEGPWTTITTINTDAEGRFSLRWTPPLGELFIRASWPGNENYEGFSEVVHVIVRRTRNTLTLTGGVMVECSFIVNMTGEFYRDTWTLELTFQGPPEYSDIVTVRIPTDILEESGIGIEDVVILVDGKAVDFIYRLEDDTYLVSFSLTFSEKKVRLILSRGDVSIMLCDDRERPIVDALVEFYYEGKTLIAKGTTNTSGLLSLRLPVGNYTIRISWRGVTREVKAQVMKEGVSVEETFKTYDLTVKVTSKILKMPIPAVVTVSGVGFTAEAATDANGVCTFKQLPPGTYNVGVRAFGTVVRESVVLEKDETIVITVYYSLEYTLIAMIVIAVVLAVLLVAVVVWARKRR